MVSVKFVQSSGEEFVVDVNEGTNLMSAAVENGIPGILGECGGACACATCHCYIDDAFAAILAPADQTELFMIEFTSEPQQQNSRLGCQVVVNEAMDNMIVYLPKTQV